MTDPTKLADLCEGAEASHFKCVSAPHGGTLFTVGAAYEVGCYERGTPLVISNDGLRCVSLPQAGYSMEPYDPWAKHRATAGGDHGRD